MVINTRSLIKLALSLLLTFPFAVQAQLYNFQTYSLDEGLSQSEVNTIYEDSRG